MKQSVFYVAKTDCPLEEQLIRNRLKGIRGIDELRFNLMERELTVTHRLDDDREILAALESLGMGPQRKPLPQTAGGTKQTVFHLPDMCCPSEAEMIRNRLSKLEGVEDLDFNLMQREVVVRHRPEDEGQLLAALKLLGMDAEPGTRNAGGGPASEAASAVADTSSSTRSAASAPHWVPLAISGVAAVAAEVTAWLTGREQSPWVIGLTVLSILIGGRDTLRKGWLVLRNLTLNINFLMTVAIAGAVAIGEWPEAAMVTFLFALAEMIEGYSWTGPGMRSGR